VVGGAECDRNEKLIQKCARGTELRGGAARPPPPPPRGARSRRVTTDRVQSACKRHRRIQSIQVRLLKSFANKQQSQNMEKFPYIVSLSIYFASCGKKLIHIRSSQPDRIGPFAKKNQKRIHACSKATKSKKATSALDR
jgi:hypothetical protein